MSYSAPLHLESTQTLLYDLPSTASLTPPTSPREQDFSGRSRTARNGRPLSGRNRSLTPIGVGPNDLEKFAENCRAWYFNQDENAGRSMTQTLATLPSSHRAPFSRVQASIRTAYHRWVNARKTAEFRAHLAATQPGGSLLPHYRVDQKGLDARKERYERVDHFIRTWCTAGMPGTKPFFQSLWAIMRLQAIPDKLGGAGKYRIEWEIDDAVFKEAAGKDFMLEAIDVLKGVLAFEEVPSTRIASAPSGYRFSNLDSIHSRSQSQPLSYDPKVLPAMAKRPRAPSDPFLDTPNSQCGAGLMRAATPTGHGGHDEEEEEEEEDYLRVWTTPDLANCEYLELVKVFPPFISQNPLPRFPVHVRVPDPEEGTEGGQVHFGTGSFWISTKERSHGWQGGWWSRLKMWWRSTFC